MVHCNNNVPHNSFLGNGSMKPALWGNIFSFILMEKPSFKSSLKINGKINFPREFDCIFILIVKIIA